MTNTSSVILRFYKERGRYHLDCSRRWLLSVDAVRIARHEYENVQRGKVEELYGALKRISFCRENCEITESDYQVAVELWREAMHRLIRNGLLNLTAVACGGFNNMEVADYRRARLALDYRLRYLDYLKCEVLESTLMLKPPLDFLFLQRAQLLCNVEACQLQKVTGKPAINRTHFNPQQPRDAKGKWTTGGGRIVGEMRSPHDYNPIPIPGSYCRYGDWKGNVQQFVEHFADAPIEHLAAYDVHGRQLCHVIGEVGRVAVPKRLASQTKDGIIVHNHPQPPVSFSLQDLFTAIEMNAKSIVVVTKVGDNTVTNSIIRRGETWDLPDKELLSAEYKRCVAQSDKKARIRSFDAILSKDHFTMDNYEKSKSYFASFEAMKAFSKIYNAFKIVEEVQNG